MRRKLGVPLRGINDLISVGAIVFGWDCMISKCFSVMTLYWTKIAHIGECVESNKYVFVAI